MHDYQDQYTWSDAFEWAANLGQSSTTVEETPTSAWMIDFSNGVVSQFSK